MKVWITKYALTTGIIETDAEVCSEDMIQIYKPFKSYFHKNEWFIKKEDAIKRANSMKDKKIQALNKQIIKLNSLTFE